MRRRIFQAAFDETRAVAGMFQANPARAAEVRLAGLRCLLKHHEIPAHAPDPPPGVVAPSVLDDIGPVTDPKPKNDHKAKYERFVAALEKHKRLMQVLDKRDYYVNNCKK